MKCRIASIVFVLIAVMMSGCLTSAIFEARGVDHKTNKSLVKPPTEVLVSSSYERTSSQIWRDLGGRLRQTLWNVPAQRDVYRPQSYVARNNVKTLRRKKEYRSAKIAPPSLSVTDMHIPPHVPPSVLAP